MTGGLAVPKSRFRILGFAILTLLLVAFIVYKGAPRASLFIHKIESPHQAETTEIRVLLPDSLDPGRRYPVVYVLPVRPQHRKDPFGDGLIEVEKLDLHNRHQVIFVMPMFTAMPWYCDHASETSNRQESHLINVVVPFVDRTYPTVSKAEGRYLLGFSKSGWGAWTLLLRHPDLFVRAVAWDAPFMLDTFGHEKLCGTQANFETFMPSRLVKTHGPKLGNGTRLIMIGYDAHRSHHLSMHELLRQVGIPHTHIDGPHRAHHWHSGWVEEAVQILLAKS
jgi:enterochelin esterase-like enzyme